MKNPFEPHLLIEQRGPVRLLTLNRPQSANAVDSALHGALARVWRHIAADHDARAVVLTGAGKAFCAGGDIGLIQDLQSIPAVREAMLEEGRAIVREMVRFPLPVVAAVNGAALGLGCSIAVLCDLVFVAESAFLGDPHVSIGLTAGDGGTATWPMFMSLMRAKEFLFTGDRISAEQAVAIGLANRVVPDGSVVEEAVAFAERLAALPPQALRSTKHALNIHLRNSVDAVLDYALAAEYHSFDTPEHQALVASFLSRPATA